MTSFICRISSTFSKRLRFQNGTSLKVGNFARSLNHKTTESKDVPLASKPSFYFNPALKETLQSVRDILIIFAAIVGIVLGCATALEAAISKPLEKQFNALQRGNDELKESSLLLKTNMKKNLDENKKDMDRKLDENKKDIKGMDKKLDLILHQKVWWFQR